MTRYSASRGIIYSAPPGPSGDGVDDGTDGAEEREGRTVEVEADGDDPESGHADD